MGNNISHPWCLCQYMFNLPNPMDWAIDYRTLGAKTQITEHLYHSLNDKNILKSLKKISDDTYIEEQKRDKK